VRDVDKTQYQHQFAAQSKGLSSAESEEELQTAVAALKAALDNA